MLDKYTISIVQKGKLKSLKRRWLIPIAIGTGCGIASGLPTAAEGGGKTAAYLRRQKGAG
jgi:hypothetical protein